MQRLSWEKNKYTANIYISTIFIHTHTHTYKSSVLLFFQPDLKPEQKSIYLAGIYIYIYGWKVQRI